MWEAFARFPVKQQYAIGTSSPGHHAVIAPIVLGQTLRLGAADPLQVTVAHAVAF